MILTKEEATAFLAEFYFGEHHIPSKLKAWGEGWYVLHTRSLSTFDNSDLTRLVVLAHDRCIRVEIDPYTFRHMKIIIHKREGREGSIWKYHPTLEDSTQRIRKALKACEPKVNQ